MARKLGQIIAVREGVWMVRIPLGRTRETQTRNYYNRTIYGSLRKAQKYLSKKMGEIGANHQGSPGKIRLNTYLDRWIKAVKPRVTDKTYRTYVWLLNRYIRPALGDKLLVAIEPLDIQSVYDKMTESGLAAATVHHVHWVLNAALRQAVQWEILVEAPGRQVKLPRIRRREMQVLSIEQAKAFLEVALPRWYGTLFAVAITTGMRPSEYIGLKWQDLDWERGTVSVKGTLRKGSTGWIFGDTRRSGSRRPIRLQNWEGTPHLTANRPRRPGRVPGSQET